MEASSLLSNKALTAERLLRVALAFVFFFAAYAGFSDPVSWASFFPIWMESVMDPMQLIVVFGVIEVILGIWLLSGFLTWFAALVAFLMLIGIVVTNMSQFSVLFRDVGLAITALALLFLSYPSHKVEDNSLTDSIG